MPTQPLPKNWPPSLPYLTTPIHSKTLLPSDILALKTHASQHQNQTQKQTTYSIPKNTPKGPTPSVKITPITSPTHPANGQSGLFATKALAPGSFILQYLGVVHKSASMPTSSLSVTEREEKATEGDKSIAVQDEHSKSDYDLSLDRDLGISIDAAVKGNEARFVNDYRGVGGRPNAEFRDLWDERGGERGIGVFVLGAGGGGGRKGNGKGREAFKGVRKGEEILVSYGRGFWGARMDGEEEGKGVEDYEDK